MSGASENGRLSCAQRLLGTSLRLEIEDFRQQYSLSTVLQALYYQQYSAVLLTAAQCCQRCPEGRTEEMKAGGREGGREER